MHQRTPSLAGAAQYPHIADPAQPPHNADPAQYPRMQTRLNTPTPSTSPVRPQQGSPQRRYPPSCQRTREADSAPRRCAWARAEACSCSSCCLMASARPESDTALDASLQPAGEVNGRSNLSRPLSCHAPAPTSCMHELPQRPQRCALHLSSSVACSSISLSRVPKASSSCRTVSLRRWISTAVFSAWAVPCRVAGGAGDSGTTSAGLRRRRRWCRRSSKRGWLVITKPPYTAPRGAWRQRAPHLFLVASQLLCSVLRARSLALGVCLRLGRSLLRCQHLRSPKSQGDAKPISSGTGSSVQFKTPGQQPLSHTHMRPLPQHCQPRLQLRCPPPHLPLPPTTVPPAPPAAAASSAQTPAVPPPPAPPPPRAAPRGWRPPPRAPGPAARPARQAPPARAPCSQGQGQPFGVGRRGGHPVCAGPVWGAGRGGEGGGGGARGRRLPLSFLSRT
jgi:hypothetical protein